MTDERRKQLETEARAYLDERRQRYGASSHVPSETKEKAVKAMAKALERLEQHA
jgi:hypothetical protein